MEHDGGWHGGWGGTGGREEWGGGRNGAGRVKFGSPVGWRQEAMMEDGDGVGGLDWRAII